MLVCMLSCCRRQEQQHSQQCGAQWRSSCWGCEYTLCMQCITFWACVRVASVKKYLLLELCFKYWSLQSNCTSILYGCDLAYWCWYLSYTLQTVGGWCNEIHNTAIIMMQNSSSAVLMLVITSMLLLLQEAIKKKKAEGRKQEKSVLQAKLTKLAIQIGYAGMCTQLLTHWHVSRRWWCIALTL